MVVGVLRVSESAPIVYSGELPAVSTCISIWEHHKGGSDTNDEVMLEQCLFISPFKCHTRDILGNEGEASVSVKTPRAAVIESPMYRMSKK